MEFIRRMFCRQKVMKDPVRTMRIDGMNTPLTPIPDDAELAAQALLETTPPPPSRGKGTNRRANLSPSGKPERGSVAYYRQLADRIKESHEHDARMATRYVACVEERLKDRASGLAGLEHGLFKWQDTVEREGGDLLKRWQKCLAEAIMRQMTATDKTTDSTD